MPYERPETNPHFLPPEPEDHDQDQHSLLPRQWAPRQRHSPRPAPWMTPTQAPQDMRVDQPQTQPHEVPSPAPPTAPLRPSRDHTDQPQPSTRPKLKKQKQEPDKPRRPPIVQPTPVPPSPPGQQSQPHGSERQGRFHQAPYPSPPERRTQAHGGLLPKPQRTKPITWFGAVFCTILWLVIILGGLAVLIVYLVFKPRSPRFDVSSVTLNAAYLDMGYLLNADITLLANFTNPNRKVNVDFSFMYLELYYQSTLLATQYIEPFAAPSSASRFVNLHLLTSQVRLPAKETILLQKQIESNRVIFDVKGVFRTRSDFGSFLKYSYWLYGHCRLMVSAPPTGVLRDRWCRTKR